MPLVESEYASVRTSCMCALLAVERRGGLSPSAGGTVAGFHISSLSLVEQVGCKADGNGVRFGGKHFMAFGFVI